MFDPMPPYSMPQDYGSVHFKPWIGCDYKTGGIAGQKILILGESHYTKKFIAEPPEKTTHYTRHIMQWAAVKHNRSFYSKVRNLVLRGANQPVRGYGREAKRQQFWDSLAFYNYVQEYVGMAPRDRPTNQMWTKAEGAFWEVINILKPDVCIVLGNTLWGKLPQAGAMEFSAVSSFTDSATGIQLKKYSIGTHETLMVHTPHPASFGLFKRKKVVPLAKRLFELCDSSTTKLSSMAEQ